MDWKYSFHRDYKEVRHCKTCNKEFITTHPSRRYCSKTCLPGRDRVRFGTVLQCKECSKDFIKRSTRQVYCGKHCQLTQSLRSKAMRYAEKNPPKYRGRRKAIVTDSSVSVCLFCKDKFGQRRRDQIYCSRRCQLSMFHHSRYRYTKGMSRNCQACGTAFTLANGNQLYCSFMWIRW